MILSSLETVDEKEVVCESGLWVFGGVEDMMSTLNALTRKNGLASTMPTRQVSSQDCRSSLKDCIGFVPGNLRD